MCETNVLALVVIFRCRANLEHISWSAPDSGLGSRHLQVEILKTLHGVPFLLDIGKRVEGYLGGAATVQLPPIKSLEPFLRLFVPGLSGNRNLYQGVPKPGGWEEQEPCSI